MIEIIQKQQSFNEINILLTSFHCAYLKILRNLNQKKYIRTAFNPFLE